MVTRKDVADYAGVSKTTVSRVLNNNGYVSPENRKKIETAIQVLGYQPNLVAKGLKTNESRQLLFYAPALANPFYIEVYKGMEAYAQKYGYTIVVSSHYDLGMIRQRQFDGLVLSGLNSHETFLAADIPTVVTDYTGMPVPFPAVRIEMLQGAKQAMNYLIALGHRQIAFVTNCNSPSEQRYRGYLETMQILGIQPEPELVFNKLGSGTLFEQGYRAGLQIATSKRRITAVFVFNDAIAIGMLAAFAKQGICIPTDLSVVAFDNIQQSRYTCPPLTTVHIPKYEQGVESIRLLIKAIKGEKVSVKKLTTQLVVRDSVAKYKGGVVNET